MTRKATYRIHEGSLQDRFHSSRNKIQVYGGGFANGKTAAVCIKTLMVARFYPGANILMARSTYPKLNDTLRRELFKWLPPSWRKNFSKTENTLELQNGTTINFRYIAQQGRGEEQSTSNLLSATYDLVVVDQIEDPEIGEKDFLDLLGRLRGMTPYAGDDPSMPRTGPRWMLITCNPTRNWVYRNLVAPMHAHARGRKTPELIVDPDNGKVLVDLFEGSTYENKENLEKDFIKTLEASYRGQMRDRFLLGKWEAYEGLVYPQFSYDTHLVEHGVMRAYYEQLRNQGLEPTIIEGYDHGIAVPSCYLIGFVDHMGNICIVDGVYGAGMTIEEMAGEIKSISARYKDDYNSWIYADPSLFRRSVTDKRTVGRAISDMFFECGVKMTRGTADIHNGITKVQSYLHVQEFHRNPFTGTYPAPRLYIASNMAFLINEITDYYWRKDPKGSVVDMPQDKNDHAMDALKYMLSRRPALAGLATKRKDDPPAFMKWHETERVERQSAHRYG